MKAIIFCVFFTMSICARGQDTCISAQLCGKKWYGEKWMDKQGKVYKFDRKQKGRYVMFNINGTFINCETTGIPIKGHWTFNESNKRLVLIEDKKRVGVPRKSTATIISCLGVHLRFVRYDFGEKMTVFSVAK